MNVCWVRSMKKVYLLMPAWVIILNDGSNLAQAGPPPIDLIQLRARVDRLADQVAELAGTDDLIDTLHFGWFDRPYARSTLAVLVKTTHALQREVRLRNRQNGAVPDATLETMLEWADRAVQRVVASASGDGFRPHRLRVAGNDFAASPSTPALFGFVDRMTATRYHRSFGDLDLAAAMGLRVYPRLDREVAPDDVGRILVERAHTLGMATILVTRSGPHADEAISRGQSDIPARSSAGYTLTVQPATLRALLQAPPMPLAEPHQSMAVIDPPFGEDWPSSLARRALARGVLGRTCYVADGCNSSPNFVSSAERSACTTAAMWVYALDGQSLGLVRGWRDLRDGSGSPYPSLTIDPARTEAMVHAALDLIRQGEYLTPFRSAPVLVVAVGDEAVDPQDANAWADWVKPIWAGLLSRQIRFDVVQRNTADGQFGRRYPAVFTLSRQDAADPGSVLLRIERLLATHHEHTDRVTVRELDDRLASDVFVREGQTSTGRWCIAVANLSERPRQLKLHGGALPGTMRDIVSDTDVRNPLGRLMLEPWQVRLLWPKS